MSNQYAYGWLVGYDKINLKLQPDIKFDWNPIFDKSDKIFDDVYPIDKHFKTYNMVDNLSDVIGKYIHDDFGELGNALLKTGTWTIGKYYGDEYAKLRERDAKDIASNKGIVWDREGNFISKERRHVLKYVFEDFNSIRIFLTLRNFDLYTKGDHILVFGRNMKLLDGIVYFLKYNKFSAPSNNITFYSYEYQSYISSKIPKIVEKERLEHVKIIDPLNNNNINKYKKTIPDKKIGIIVIDVVINIPNLLYSRTNYSFQTIFSLLLLTLPKLKDSGSLILDTIAPTNKMVFNFYLYLATFFDSAFIYPHSDVQKSIINISFVFVGYKGSSNISFDDWEKFNNNMYIHDPNGGHDYTVSNEYEKPLFNKKIHNHNERMYVTKIVDIANLTPELTGLYDNYRALANVELDLIAYRNQKLYNHYVNRDDKQYIKNVVNNVYIQAIQYAKENKLDLADWAETIPDDYFNNFITSIFTKLNTVYLYKVKKNNVNITPSHNITVEGMDHIKTIAKLNELIFSTIDGTHPDKYTQVELFFNHHFKKLNNVLKKKNISFNGHNVSRAWIKMYELLNETNFYNNMPDNINAFFICEAPGNFIGSTLYYIKNKTSIEKFNWTAQSYAEGEGDIYDTFGFIEHTKDHWDFGKTKTGDITDINNFKYYLEKYNNVDVLVGDCGMRWGGSKAPIEIFQCIYAILFPKKGGSFIIKLYSLSTSKLYYSLLYVLTSLYEDVSIFKSNTNFWSAEIYLIGQNKLRDLTEAERTDMINIAIQAKHGEGDYLYPVNKVPHEFIDEYKTIISNIYNVSSKTKLFFAFLSYHQGLFKENKTKLVDLINKKIEIWVKKYL
jgi:hypothetical protein